MKDLRQAPATTAHKAIAASIAALLCSIGMTTLGLTPTAEGLLEADLRALVENVAALIIMTVIPGIVTYYKRNYLK